MTKNIKICPLSNAELSEAYSSTNYNISAMPMYIKDTHNIELTRTQVERFLDVYGLKLTWNERCIVDCPWDSDTLRQKILSATGNIEEFIRRERNPKITAARVQTWLKHHGIPKTEVMSRIEKSPCPVTKNVFIDMLYDCAFVKADVARKIEDMSGKPHVNRYAREFGINLSALRREFDSVISCTDRESLLTELELTGYDYDRVKENMQLPHTSVIEKIFNKNKLASFQILSTNRAMFDNTTLGDISAKLNVPVCHVKEYRILRDIPVIDSSTSAGEIELMDYVKSLGFTNSHKKHCKVQNTRFDIDVFVPHKNIGFEFNGSYWHSDDVRDELYHRDKITNATKLGISLYHIFDHEWTEKPHIVKSMIRHKLGLTQNRLHARKLILDRFVTAPEEKRFLLDNHIQGYARSSVRLGLRDATGHLLMLLTLAPPRFNKSYQWEVIRVATKCDSVVSGGLSRLMSAFVKEHDPDTILTYADLRYGLGDAYVTSGFVHVGTTAPGYYYSNSIIVKSRYQCQKHKLTKLPKYDSNLTEKDIMRKHGFFRIYDAGNAKYEYRRK